ncbi:DUF305 domain-containing protein [Georgenia muralis]
MLRSLTNRRSAVAAATLATVLVLGACSEADDPAATPTTASATTAAPGAADEATSESTTDESMTDAVHNDADTEFAQMMIVHHEGAIEMAELAASDASTEEVRALGERISAAQGPEIDLMTSWLEAWGEPTAAEDDMAGMDHGGMDMGGLSQEEAMAELESAEGAELDRRFLELMIEHHRGAIEMAEGQLDEGADPAALALAEQIIADQEAEIAEMEELLAGL